MTVQHEANTQDDTNLGPLGSLPVVAAHEFDSWLDRECSSRTTAVKHDHPGDAHDTSTNNPELRLDDREYRFCKAVGDNPLMPSSGYAKLAGMSSKTSVAIRPRLVAEGFIRERMVDPAGRGASTILLELLPAGTEAVNEYQAHVKE
jgi:hypothetical protein